MKNKNRFYINNSLHNFRLGVELVAIKIKEKCLFYVILAVKNTHLIPKRFHPKVVAVVRVSNRYNPKTDIVRTHSILSLFFLQEISILLI